VVGNFGDYCRRWVHSRLRLQRLLLFTIPYEAPLPHVTVLLAPNQTMDRNLVLLSRNALSSPGEEVLGKNLFKFWNKIKMDLVLMFIFSD